MWPLGLLSGACCCRFKRLLKKTVDFSAFGEVFGSIGVREPQPAASEAFTKFGEAHRNMERFAIRMLKTVKPVSSCTKNINFVSWFKSKFSHFCITVMSAFQTNTFDYFIFALTR
jgi:hypothetical protein